MKVLLLHEMSGVHTELKKGLRALGIDAKIATFGDGWKSYETDISLGAERGFARGSVSKIVRQIDLVRRVSDFDVVQSISPTPFLRPINRLLQSAALKNTRKFIYIAAGSDAVYRKHVRTLPYFPPHDWYDSPKDYRSLAQMLKQASSIIPVCYEYDYCMKLDGWSTTETVPFPVEMSRHNSARLAGSRKLRIFHPLNRLDPNNDFKGTRIIRQVFDSLSKRYSDVADFIIAGGLPHSEYDKLTDGVDIIVDQLNSMSYGMSATYGMAKGKVVLSGLEEVAKSVSHYGRCPIINASPDPVQLEQQIEDLILNRSSVRQIGEESRAYAEEFHDHIKVAGKFAEIYSA